MSHYGTFFSFSNILTACAYPVAHNRFLLPLTEASSSDGWGDTAGETHPSTSLHLARNGPTFFGIASSSSIVSVLMPTVSVLMRTRFWDLRQTQMREVVLYVIYVHECNFMFMPTSFYVRRTDKMYKTQSHQFLAN